LPHTINRGDFFSIWQETNPDLGIILVGFDSSLPLQTHNQILLILQETADQYFIDEDLTNPLGTFENVLGQFNDKFLNVVKEQISWTKKINLTVALLLERDLHFVNFGHNHLLLIRHKHFVDIIKSMAINIPIPGNKIFDQIYSGSVNKFSRLTLCNQATFDYITTDKIRDILSLLPLNNIGDQINQLTTTAKKNQIIAGVVMQIEQATEISTEPTFDSDRPSQKSIDNLLATSRQTSQLLKPQLLPDLSNITKPLRVLFSKQKNLKEPQKSLSGNRYKKINLAKLSLNDLSYKATNFLRKLRHQKDAGYTIFKNLPTNSKYLFKNLKYKYNHLPKSSKYLLLVALILLSLLTVNLISLGLKKHSQVQTQYYDSVLSQIQSYQDEAQAAIIYGDNKKARQLLKESTNLIYNLPKNNDNRKSTYEKLFTTNNTLLADANKIQVVDSPLLLLNLLQFDSQLKPQRLFIYKGKLMVLTSEKLLNIDITSNQITSHTLTDYNISSAQTIIGLDNITLIYTTTGQIFRFDPINNSFTSTETTLTAAGDNIKAAASYNERLYFLDSGNQILRMDPLGTNFSSARNWLQDESDLSKSLDIAIDGNVYILIDDGSILKLTRGRQTDFSLEEIEPDLTNVTHLFTDTDIPYIYLLDPTNKRLVIYDNNGQLIKQYQFNELNDLKDFAIDYKAENEKSIVYLLTKENVYQILIDE